ncbi:hypothetical protein Tco_0146141 [Tanacetum coccineum]
MGRYMVGISKPSNEEFETKVTQGMVLDAELLDCVFKVPITTIKCIPYGCWLAFSQVLKIVLYKVVAHLDSSGLASYCDDTIKALEAKHPCKPPSSMSSSTFSKPPIVADIDSVFSCIKSFPKGTSCRRNGLRAQHILDALCEEWYATATNLLKLELYRRLVSKVAMKGVGKEISKYLSDFQFGLGVSSGADALLHNVNRVLSEYHNDGSLVMLTVDFLNAFNLADRSELLHEDVARRPIETSSFCSCIAPVSTKIKDNRKLLLYAWYLDDETIIRDSKKVVMVLDIIRVSYPGLGLELNIKEISCLSCTEFEVFGMVYFLRIERCNDLM